jgi:hypothetical protein
MTFKRRDLLLVAARLTGGVLIGSPMLRVMAGEAPQAKASRAIFSSPQSQAIAALAEMIIPQTDTPGAIAAGTPAFIEMMAADWYTDTERKIFLEGLAGLDIFCRASFGKDFLASSEEQRTAALADAEKRAASYVSPLPGGFLGGMSKEIDENTPFFAKIKELTVIGYYSSEVGAKQEMAYNPMPMRYEGDYDFAKIGRHWSY